MPRNSATSSAESSRSRARCGPGAAAELEVRDIGAPSFARTVDQCGVQVDPGRPRRRGRDRRARSKPFADGADDFEVGGAGEGDEAFANRLEELPASVDEAGERDALEVGAALGSVLDDVGDAAVEPVEEELESREHAWFDDGVRGNGAQAYDGVGA